MSGSTCPPSKADVTSTLAKQRLAEPERRCTSPIRSTPSRIVLIDPNTLSEDGTVALTGTEISEDGKLMAYGVGHAGSDWEEWQVRDVDTGQGPRRSSEMDQVLRRGMDAATAKAFSIAGIDEPKEGEQLEGVNYFQKLYLPQARQRRSREDRLVYDRPDHKDWGFGGHVTEDGKYLIITHLARARIRKNTGVLSATRRQEPSAAWSSC